VIGHRNVGMSAFRSTCGLDGSMSECYVVHGYRFCQSSTYWRQMPRRVAIAGLPKSQQAAQEPSNQSRTLQYLKWHSALVRVIAIGSAA